MQENTTSEKVIDFSYVEDNEKITLSAAINKKRAVEELRAIANFAILAINAKLSR